jgi:hypothetical protein
MFESRLLKAFMKVSLAKLMNGTFTQPNNKVLSLLVYPMHSMVFGEKVPYNNIYI